MRIGVPMERMVEEYRVGATPAAAHVLVTDGHEVSVERGAGQGAGFSDQEYLDAGCQLVSADGAWEAELVVKVKQPEAEEYRYFRPALTLFSYLHLAPAPDLTAAMLESGMTAIGLETVQPADGRLPLLAPMSQIAGRMAVLAGAHFLQRPQGSAGILPGGIPGVPSAQVVIVGGGTVGLGAARVAVGLGARVVIMDSDPERLRALDDLFDGRVATLIAQPLVVQGAVRDADLVIGAVLVPGARAPHVISTSMVRSMHAGSVIVDVAVDQGGCVETCDHVSTHRAPVYERYGVLHYAVANIPACVPRTATQALTNATLPYLRRLAAVGWRKAATEDPALARGINVAEGSCVCRPVAEAQGRQWTAVSALLGGTQVS